jgi:hypothetical protein
VGLRGVGKTVLLVKVAEIAEKEGFQAVSVEAHEGKTLPELLAPGGDYTIGVGNKPTLLHVPGGERSLHRSRAVCDWFRR